MKYILELDESSCTHECGMDFYKCKQIPWWDVSDRVISKLLPYTEPDRKAIEDEVWEFVNFLENKLIASDYDDIFDDNSPYDYMSYQEAKAKYEAWLKQRDEIKVGDEVIIPGDINYNKMIITRLWKDMYDSDAVDTIGYDGRICSFLKCKVKKTGRHFPEAVELLQKMRGEEQ